MDVLVGPPTREFNVTTNVANPSKTEAFDIGGWRISHVKFPGTVTGASYTLEASADGVTFTAVGGVSITVATSTYVPLTSDANFRGTAGLRFVKLVSASQEGAARTIGVVLCQV